MIAPERRDVGARLIVAYKVVKAVGEVLLAATLVVLAATGEMEALRDLAHHLREDVASRWSLLVGRALAAVTTRRGLHLLQIGLVLDGILSAVEGWSLWLGHRWGEWLVVAATATPLPLEVAHFARTHRPSRAALIAVNLAVVLYLARRIARRSTAPRSHRGRAPRDLEPGREENG